MGTGQHGTPLQTGAPTDSRYYLAIVGGAGWLFGIWLGSVSNLPAAYWVAVAVAAGCAAVLFWRKRRAGLLLAGCAAVALGAWRFTLSQPDNTPADIHYYNGARNIALTGWVTDEPEVTDTSTRLRVEAEEVIINGQAAGVDGLVLVQTSRFPLVPYGATVRLFGRLDPPEALGSSDYAVYLKRRALLSLMSYPQVEVLSSDGGLPFYRWLLGVKDRGRAILQHSLPEPHAALLTGILLGDDSGMPRDLIESFRVTGMTHIIAISGFNIALLIALMDRLAAPIIPRRQAAMLIIVLIAVYAALVGGAPSVVRAVIMGIAFLIASRMLGRRTLAVSSLFVAAVLMTGWTPWALWDIGFQLSFAATLGLMLFAGPWTRRMRRRVAGESPTLLRQSITILIGDLLIVTLAAQILTLPLLLYHFGRLSIVNLPANLLVLPAQPGVMLTGGATLLLGAVSETLARLPAWLAWLLLDYTIAIIHWLAEIPGASLPLNLSGGGFLVVYLVIGTVSGFLLLDRQRQEALKYSMRSSVISLFGIAVAVIVSAVLFLSWGRRPDERLHVSFLDVGQGDAVLIQSPGGRQVLIDGGRYPSRVLEGLGQQLPFWDRSLDLVIATHPDEDHIAGLISVIDRYRVGRLVTNGMEADGMPVYEALLSAAGDRSVAIHRAIAGEVIDLGDGVRIEVLAPAQARPAGRANTGSIVTRLTFGELSVLLTGDAETDAEEQLLSSGRPLDAIVLKAGHHGANTSSSESFLRAVQPQIIVISVGADNTYGHPHPAVLNRAAAVGATVLRTDELGTIELMSDGRQMWWQSDD